MPPVWLLKLGGVLTILVGAWLHGHHVGAAGVQADWDKQRTADEKASADAAAANRTLASLASTTYEAQRAVIAQRATSPSPEARNALHATICPAAGASAPLELGAVPVPAAVLQRLRDAGADPASH